MHKRFSTLSEVARRCGVSQSTVSRVLNNSRSGRFSVSPAVEQRIRRIARELNYRPSFAARNLASGKTRLVAVLGIAGVWSDRVGPVEEAVGALAAGLDRAGYEICLQFISRRHAPFDLPPLRVDGVVAVGPRLMSDLAELDEAQVPYVSLNGVVGPRGSQVIPDDAGGTRLALKHLVDLGHRRIAYLDHPSVDGTHMSVIERRAAFVEASEEFGFEAPKLGLPLLGPDAPWDMHYEPFLKRAVIQCRATAVLSYSHHAAVALLRTAHDAGLTVPNDFSLVCFNDEPLVRLTVPSLTAVHVPSIEMGQAAAELLLRQMTLGTATPQRACLKESLIVRESSARPANFAQ